MPSREENIQHEARKCCHFNGVQHDQCRAGVYYKALPRELHKWGSFVCFGQSTGCEHFQANGIEAAKKRFDEIDESSRRVTKAMQAIIAKHGDERGIEAVMDCPVCGVKQALRYSIANYNGHIHGKCRTKDCVAWMQ